MSEDLTAADWLCNDGLLLHECEVKFGGWCNANKKWKKAHQSKKQSDFSRKSTYLNVGHDIYPQML